MSLKNSPEIIQDEDNILSEHEIRVTKVKKMREAGIEPWPEAKTVENSCLQVLQEYKEGEEKSYSIAGRVMTKRLHGKAAFVNIVDSTGKLQLYFKSDKIGGSEFEKFTNFIDIGDIIWVDGISFKTKTGEITLQVKSFKLLSKCLYPLPEKFHGLTHVETRYRQRYLDLMTNEETKERFIKRSKIVSALRNYFDVHGYIEVETPMLHPIAGGAAARPFVTHHNTLNTDLYLRIAPELYLKRLVVGGIDKVYEINRNFRNEGVSTRHNPEFTMVEFYTAHKDYNYIMDFVEQLLQDIAKKVSGSLQLQYGNHTIDFSKFYRLSPKEAVLKYGNLSEEAISEKNIDNTLEKYQMYMAKSSYGEKIFALFEKLAEHQLIQPTFIIDFPIENSPLAKRDSKNPNIAARFELFIAGMELSNGFNELNDPFDQADRFKQQLEEHKSGNEEAHQYDADYIHALEYALPPTVGVGIGIDRLVMLLTNCTSIKDVILFPALKTREQVSE